MVEPQLIEDHGLIGCPHCGSEPTVTRRPAHKHTGPLAGFMPPVGESVTVECIRCGAGMIGESLEELHMRWNARTPAAQEIGDA